MDSAVWILIPAYNEAPVIGGVLQNVKKLGFERILVIDDGSKDATAQIARAGGAEVLCLLMNRGQGAALKAGMEYLRDVHGAHVVVTFDADGQHAPEDIQAIIRPVLEDAADITLGSRFLSDTGKIPRFRKHILKAGVIFTNILSRVQLTDTHNGFRGLSRKALEKIRITHRGMEHSSDIIDQISKKNLRYQEVPVHILYTDYSLQKGQKTSHFFKMGLRLLLRKLM